MSKFLINLIFTPLFLAPCLNLGMEPKDNQQLSNQQLLEFIADANDSDIQLFEPALKALTERILNRDDLQKLMDLDDKLKDFWRMHPAMGMFTLQKPAGVLGVLWHPTFKGLIITRKDKRDKKTIESKNGKYIISWAEDAIKVCSKNNLQAKPLVLGNKFEDNEKFLFWTVQDVMESKTGSLLIARFAKFEYEPLNRDFIEGCIKVLGYE